MISRVSLILVILSTSVANAQEAAFKIRSRSSPFFGVELTLNDQPLQSLPAGAKVEVAESALLSSQVGAFNQLKVCFKGSQISNSKPNIHNLGVVEMLPVKKVKPILRFVSTSANQFVPGSMNCGLFYFTPTSLITQAEYQAAMGSHEVVSVGTPSQGASDTDLKIVKGAGGTAPQGEKGQGVGTISLPGVPSPDPNQAGSTEKLQSMVDQLRALSSMAKEGQTQDLPPQKLNGNGDAPIAPGSGLQNPAAPPQQGLSPDEMKKMFESH